MTNLREPERYKGFRIVYRLAWGAVTAHAVNHKGQSIYEATDTMGDDARRKLINVIDANTEES
jgi:hypothetical protein